MASSSSKKRKREAVDTSKGISFALAEQPVSQIGPVLVSFPAIEPSKSTSFSCYLKKPRHEDEVTPEFVDQGTFVAGEAEAIEFFSSDESQRASVGSRYLVGVHNKRTGTTTLRPAPLHLLTHRVKALKGIKSAPVSAQERTQARATLGETFGTKKAKANIRAQERNKVDVSAMEGVAEHLQDRIEQSTGALPTQEEAKETADNNRLIPTHNPDAEVPGDVYPLHNIIPEAEWKALSTSAFTAAASNKECIALLPYSRSTWINQHLSTLFAASVLNKKNLKILYYISAMLAFRNATFKKFERSAVEERLSGVPSIVIDGLFSRFTETSRGSTNLQTTTQTQTTILTYIFALCLRMDDYAAETTPIASDLSMPVTRINQLFRALGCSISTLNQKDLTLLGLPNSAGEKKRAVLKCPVQFPKPKGKKHKK
ncbi:hypothetical protein PILCRDRAFT_812811 [Piloderma croceum F 1598]|uniref:Rpa49 subunit specific to nuclear RNA polymerase I n=1 Tax=Piloderma croceum (strain F 1598) TaxID=765440 RepID=A0A0C3BTX4_PILCF|nr:hypothetical protein PILCRDRAFT_812811 [Piloderma croceum F 1598]